MFHVVGITPEAHTLQQATGGGRIEQSINYGEAQRRIAYEKSNAAHDENVEYVLIGCPHYNPERLRIVTELLEGRKVHSNVRLMIFTSTQQKTLLERSGWLEVINQSGAHLVSDGCPIHVKVPPTSVIAVDSAKISHQSAGERGWQVWYGSTEDCIDAAVTGKWRGELG